MDKDYIKIVKDRLPILQAKLQEIEKVHGKFSERWHIANANLIEHEHIVKHGTPKNVHQSTEIPYDLVEGF